MVAEGHAKVALVVTNRAPAADAQRRSRLRSWIANRGELAYAAYNRLDAWKFAIERDPLEPGELGSLVADVPVIEVTPRRTKFSDYFEDADVEQILAYDLDVAVRLGFRILRGRALQIARFGVWSWHHGDNRVNRGGPPGFWEVMLGQHATGAILQVLGESLDDGTVLMRGWSRTQPHSVRHNRAAYYWQAAPFLSRALRTLATRGPTALGVPGEDPGAPMGYGERLFTTPTNGQMLRCMARVGARWAWSHVRARLSQEQWIIGYRRSPGAQGLPDLAPHRFRMMVPPTDRFWADPFPIHIDGKDWIFFEEFLYASQRGHISVCEVDSRGDHGPVQEALVTDYHLSYPFLFQHDGDCYMIPETASTGRVELWKASRFPDQWKQVAVLAGERPLVDATIACIEGRWWMFAAGSESAANWDELYLFSAPSPLGPWTPHANNPVISDVRSARPAGRLFQKHGTWYRPAQDGSRTYGGAITIQRIDRLDDTAYCERPVSRIEPHWRPDLVATHTINADGDLTVIDARRRRWFWQR